MDADARVCPFCGEPPGAGVFCEACGRNLGEVERLPTRAAWEGERDGGAAAASTTSVDAFLAAMHAAGDPGAEDLPRAQPGFLGRTRHARGWIVSREPGLFITVEGDLHRLDSATRGINHRGPTYFDVVGPEAEADVGEGLAALLRRHGL